MPVKRSEELQPLSRQHHNGLLFCLLLKKGINKKADIEVMQEFIQSFWYKDLHHHFELEEKYLVPLQKHYHRLESPLERMMSEHYDLKNIVNEISLNVTYESVQQLQDKLEAHIRFEERELFPLIEAIISENERSTIGSLLSQEKDDNCMSYPIKFWE
jgi:hemerythrin-like domain-containing protein